MFKFKSFFALSVLCVALALGAAAEHYRQQALRWQKEAERRMEISRHQASELARAGAMQRDLSALDKHHTEKLHAAEQENNALRAELASGSRRMLVTGTRAHAGDKCARSPAGRVGYEATVGLSAATGQRILSVREGIIRDQQKLIYLQAYIRNVCLK